MATTNGREISVYPMVRMAELHQHIWAEPRAFDGQDEDHNPRTMDGDREAMYCSPLFRGPRRHEAQRNASATVSIDSDADPFTEKRETIFPDCVEDKCCRTAYLLGRADAVLERIPKG